jgi:hypothetical protein
MHENMVAGFEGLMLQARSRSIRAVVACETHEMALLWFREFADRYPQDIERANENRRQVTLTNGTMIDFRGLQTPNNFAGPEYGYVLRVLKPEMAAVVRVVEALTMSERRSLIKVLESTGNLELGLRLEPRALMTAESR